jgi:hypothetical protein
MSMADTPKTHTNNPVYAEAYMTESWRVEAYREEVEGKWLSIVELEALALSREGHELAVGRLYGWLKEALLGHAAPTCEPAIQCDECELRYRPEGKVVAIFALVSEKRRLLVLRFARSANTLPTASDLSLAAKRLSVARRLNPWDW